MATNIDDSSKKKVFEFLDNILTQVDVTNESLVEAEVDLPQRQAERIENALQSVQELVWDIYDVLDPEHEFDSLVDDSLDDDMLGEEE